VERHAVGLARRGRALRPRGVELAGAHAVADAVGGAGGRAHVGALVVRGEAGQDGPAHAVDAPAPLGRGAGPADAGAGGGAADVVDAVRVLAVGVDHAGGAVGLLQLAGAADQVAEAGGRALRLAGAARRAGAVDAGEGPAAQGAAVLARPRPVAEPLLVQG